MHCTQGLFIRAKSHIMASPGGGMRPIKVLFYIDSGTVVTHCVTAAELIRKELGAHIVMMIVDANKYIDETTGNYEIYDYGSLFSIPQRLKRVWPQNARTMGQQRWSSTSRPWRYQSLFTAGKKIAQKSQVAKVIILPPLFILMMTDRLLRYVRSGFRSVSFELRTRLVRVGATLRVPLRWLLTLLRGSGAGQLSFHLSRLLISARGVGSFLDKIQPDVIILPEDNVETISTIFVAKGCSREIPSIVIPFTIPNPLEPARYYFDNPLFEAKGLFASLLIRTYPKWLLHYEGKKLFRQPALKALCQELLGISSPAPWILNRGGAVSITLDSEAQRDHYLTLGFPRKQLKIIGDINGQNVSQITNKKCQYLAELYERLGLQPGRPLILCGFPPDQYGGTDTSRFEFSDYEDLINGWMKGFRALGQRANIVIRPHPRIPVEQFEGFEDANIKFTFQPTTELIPLCDLYVASISATIRWAIARGIPVVNYDTFRYRYADYDSAPGVITVENNGKFCEVIERFVNEPEFASRIAERQRSVMRYWGMIDDRVGERLAAAVKEAVAGSGRLRNGGL